jgi:NACHT domain- and WD repeat-containing protein
VQRRELTFRVFVSSTFSDLKAERDALQRDVFPRVREYCTKHGARFQAIDLRWGVSEEAALDQQTMNICLEELRRCQRTSPRPNFIILLGQRYGWCPLPPQIPATEFELTRNQLTAEDDRALLVHWYRRDDNAVPPEYYLQPRRVEGGANRSDAEKEMAREAEAREWAETERRLRSILLAGVNRLAWPQTDERRLKYEASATHQEILHGALKVTDTIDHVFGFFRSIEELPQDGSARDYLDLDPQGRPDAAGRKRLERLQADLRERLPNNILTYTTTWTDAGPSSEHIRQLSAEVFRRLLRVIRQEIKRRNRSDPVDQEAFTHQTFGQERARVFIGRRDLLRRIQNYLDDQDPHPLVVHGVSGSGKSALLSKAVADHESRVSNHEVIVRYIGATPASSDIRSMLEGLCKEITLRYGGDASTVPMEYTKLEVEFTNRLALATAEKPLVVFLDALDQLSDADNGRNLSWLPAQLPEHVRLVVSTLELRSQKKEGRRGADDCLGVLRERLPAQQFLEVTPMKVDEGEELLAAWLHQAQRSLQPQQRDEVLTKFRGCPYPLYLKLAFEEARGWKSSEPAATVPDCQTSEAPLQHCLSPDTLGILKDMFARLEAERNHGRLLVSRALGYLAASRHGLTEDELLDVLSADKDVIADFRKRSPKSPTLDRLPVVVWARLFAELEPYMTQRQADGTTVLTFYHREVNEAAATRYLPDQEKRRFHDALATYFRNQADPQNNQSWKGKEVRPFLEVPFQLANSNVEELARILLDFRWLEAKTGKALVQELIQDHGEALQRLPSTAPQADALRLVRQCLQASLHVLSEDATHLAGQLVAQLSDVADLNLERLTEGAKKWRKMPWMMPTTASLAVDKAEQGTVWMLQYGLSTMALTPDGRRAVVGDVNGGIHLCDLAKRTKLVTLKRCERHDWARGEEAIWRIKITKDGRYAFAALGRGVVFVYDLIKRCETLRIGHKGVRVVAISPDARYFLSAGTDGDVHIWDFVDRSLTSTLTPRSDGLPHTEYYAAEFLPNGHVFLVAESMLCEVKVEVWNWREGKKICDLEGQPFSGPCCAAITPDGSCALIGVGDGSVRTWELDTQRESRTLRGHADEVLDVAVTPDSRLVVSASADHSMRVWNLSTGQCSLELSGHTDEVCSIAITPDRRNVVSVSKDGTLRLWDLAVERYELRTPRHSGPVTCLAVTPDGHYLISGTTHESPRVWELETGKLVRTLAGSPRALSALKVTPDGECVVASEKSGAVTSWDIKSGTILDTIDTREEGLSVIALSPDGRHLLAIGQERGVVILDWPSGGTLRCLDGQMAAMDPNGRFALLGLEGNKHRALGPGQWTTDHFTTLLRCELLDLHAEPMPMGEATGFITAIAITPDSRFGISCHTYSAYNPYAAETLCVWDLGLGSLIHCLEGHDVPITEIGLTRDSKHAVSGCRRRLPSYLPLTDENVCVWDLVGGRRIHKLKVRSGVNAVALTRDDHFVVAVSDDWRVRVWDLVTGELAAVFIGKSPILCCVVAPDGKTVVAGEQSGRIHFLRLVLPDDPVGMTTTQGLG